MLNMTFIAVWSSPPWEGLGEAPYLKLHSLSQFVSFGSATEVLHKGKAKFPCRTRATSGEDIAIGRNLGCGVGGASHRVFKAGIAGSLLALKQT